MSSPRLEGSQPAHPVARADKLAARERLLRAVELLPEDTSVTLSRDALIDALIGPEPTAPEPQPSPSGDRLLTVAQVADVLGMSPRWVYDNAEKLPFTRRIKRGVLRFSQMGLDKYLSTKR